MNIIEILKDQVIFIEDILKGINSISSLKNMNKIKMYFS